eukprot:5439883-Alexandrium_andersonii.AAC.1
MRSLLQDAKPCLRCVVVSRSQYLRRPERNRRCPRGSASEDAWACAPRLRVRRVHARIRSALALLPGRTQRA